MKIKSYLTSVITQKTKYYNNLVVGKMKVEICDVSIKGFVGLNFKMYTFIRQGTNKNVADDKLKFEDCKFFFFNKSYMRHKMNRNQGKYHNIGQHRINKISLYSYDDTNFKLYTYR